MIFLQKNNHMEQANTGGPGDPASVLDEQILELIQ